MSGLRFAQCLAIGCLLMHLSAVAFATDYVVTNLYDSGIGSLRAAITSANDVAGPNNITFTPGLRGTIYLSSDLPALTCSNGTTIDGDTDGDGKPDIMLDGQNLAWVGLSIYSSNNQVRHLAVGGVTGIGLLVSGASHVSNTIAGCCVGVALDGTTPAPFGGLAIHVTGCEATIDGTTVTGTTTWCAVYIADHSTVSVTNCQISGSAGFSIFASQGSAVTLTDNTISDSASTAIQVMDEGTTATIEGNVISEVGAGIAVGDGVHATVSNNSVTDGTSCALGVWGGAQITASGNTFTGNAQSVFVGGAGTVADLTSNTLSANKGWAAVYLIGPSTVSVTNCQISGSAGFSIFASQGSAVTLTDNTISDSASTAIQLMDEGTTGTIEGNVISKVGTGIAIGDYVHATVNNNSVTDGAWCALTGWGGAQISASGNTFTGNAQSISLSGAGTVADLTSNTVTGDKAWAAVFLTGGPTVTLNDCQISGSAGFSIFACQGSAVTLTGNTITDSASTAIQVMDEGTTATIEGNVISAVGTGIAVGDNVHATVNNNSVTDGAWCALTGWGGAQISASGNTFTGNAQSITLSGAGTVADLTSNTVTGDKAWAAVFLTGGPTVTLTDCQISGSAGFSVFACQGSVVTLTDSLISDNAGTGVYAGDQGTVARIKNNEFTGGAAGNPINLCLGATGEVTGNEIHGNTGWVGIAVCDPGTSFTVSGNRVYDNLADGISVWNGADVVVSGNQIHDNAWRGVGVGDVGTRCTISQNSIYDNGSLGIDLGNDWAVTLNGTKTPPGPNNWCRYPVVVERYDDGTQTTLSGTAPPNSTVEVFTAAPDPCGYGEGKTYLKSVTAGSDGNFGFQVSDTALPITMTATDPEGNTSEFSAWALPNRRPVANAGADRTVEGNTTNGAKVQLDGSGSTDPDGDALFYTWTWTDQEQATHTATGVSPTVFLELGSTDITLVVNDGHADSAPVTVTIKVQDTTPPDFTLTPLLSGGELWPPDHRMELVATLSGVCDVCDAAPAVVINVSANEPILSDGTGDGNTNPDWEVRKDGATWEIWLRAERSGGSSRIYEISVTVSDCSGNSRDAKTTVTVPHDQGESE